MTREGSKAVPLVAAGIATAFLLSPADGATPPAIIRVSVDSSGAQANGRSDPYPSISADGRFVAFASVASNLVAGDTNGASDIFVHGLVSRETTRVSVDSGGAQADAVSSRPAVSGDGRFIAFQSAASNLVAGDTNGASDIFVHDRESGETTRVSVANDGGQANASSFEPGINADGRFVTFFSPASNLVEGDTNNTYDAFVHDRVSGATIRASVDSAGVEGNSFSFMTTISGDGRVVAFESLSSNLVAGDTNSNFDIFAHDLETGATTRVSVGAGGTQGNNGSHEPTLNADGRFVAFHSFAINLIQGDTNGAPDVFIHDRASGTTARLSMSSGGAQANASSFEPAVGGAARLLAFRSGASNLVEADTNAADDIFVVAQRPHLSSTPPEAEDRRPR